MRLRVTLALSLLAPALVPALTTAPAVGMPPVESSAAKSGYWTLGVDGHVTGFGDATAVGDSKAALGSAPAVDLEPAGTGGYWILDRAGRVHNFGTAADHGDATGLMSSGERATSLSATPTAKGYWVFTNKGRTISFGDAVHHGDMAGKALNAPVRDSVVTQTGRGYWMVAADGGIFTFGDADFHGSTGNIKLNAPVQSLVPDGDGAGYWLVASDGGIFSFDAPFRGSMGATPLNKPVTGMVRYGNGYLMVAEDGGIFTFSDLPFAGSLGDKAPAQPIVAVAALGQSKSENATVVPDTTSTTTTTDGDDARTPTTTTTAPSTTTTLPPSGPWSDASAPAGLPAEQPTHVLPCADGGGKSAVVWHHHQDGPWAAWNACTTHWVVMRFPGESVSDPYGAVFSVAPGVHFTDSDDILKFSSDRETSTRISLAARSYDGTTQCPGGYGLWELSPRTGGKMAGIVSCPTGGVDSEDDVFPPYDGPLCFGRRPTVVGTPGDDVFTVESMEAAGRPWYVAGIGGNDTLDLGTPEGQSPDVFHDTPDVFFCAGDGDDTAIGMYDGFDGGTGQDTAVSHCGGSLVAVESKTETGCSGYVP